MYHTLVELFLLHFVFSEYNNIDNYGFESICKSLETNSSIKSVHLGKVILLEVLFCFQIFCFIEYNSIGSAGAQNLKTLVDSYIKNNRINMKFICLRNNSINGYTILDLAKSIASYEHPLKIDLGKKGLTDQL